MDSRDGQSDEQSAGVMAALAADLEGTPYVPLGIVGRGAMGAVFEIQHKLLGRRLVLKILRASHRPDLEDRLRLEAQTLAQLSHPSLLEVVDFGRTRSGKPYLVTELLRGMTLKEILGERGFLSVEEACHHVREALLGLASAHRAGVIHRDIKTDNLFVCDASPGEPPRMKIIDFGIAKVAEAEDAALQVRVDPLETPTAEGVMVGTPSFMSPEQIFAQKVDARTDLFSMGMVLYRLVAGRGPFQHRDVLKTVESNALEAAPAPSSVATQPIPKELDAVVSKALEKRREDRFQSAREMADALAPFCEGAPAPRAREGQITLVRAGRSAKDDAPTVRDLEPPEGVRAQASEGLATPRGTVRMDAAPSRPRALTVPLAPKHGAAPERPRGLERAPPSAGVERGRSRGVARIAAFILAISLAGGLTLLVFKLLGWA